jgi:hypothetical protein
MAKDVTWWELSNVDPKEKTITLWRDAGRFHPYTNEDMGNPTCEVSFDSVHAPETLALLLRGHEEGKLVEVGLEEGENGRITITGVFVRES